jgi:hypothetical protein
MFSSHGSSHGSLSKLGTAWKLEVIWFSVRCCRLVHSSVDVDARLMWRSVLTHSLIYPSYYSFVGVLFYHYLCHLSGVSRTVSTPHDVLSPSMKRRALHARESTDKELSMAVIVTDSTHDLTKDIRPKVFLDHGHQF